MTPHHARAASLLGLLRNAFALLGAYVLPRVFSLAAIIVAARAVGPEHFGTYGTAAGFAIIVSIVATLGLTPLLTREIARNPADARDLLAAAHRLKHASGAIMLCVMAAIGFGVAGYPMELMLVALLLGLQHALSAYSDNLFAYFQAIERMHIWTEASALLGIVGSLAGIIVVLQTGSIVWFAATAPLGQLAALVWLHYRLPPALAQPAPVRSEVLRGLVRALVPFAAASVVLTMYYKIDVLLLARVREGQEVGVYVAAAKFVDILQALVMVAATAIYPRLSRGRENAAPVAGRLAEIVVLGVTIAAGLLWLVKVPLVALSFGDAYTSAAQPAGVLALALPAIALNLVAVFVLGARGAMGSIAYGYAGALVVNAILNLLLDARFGASGAAAAKLVSELMLSGAILVVLQHHASAPRWATAGVIAQIACAGTAVSLLPEEVGLVTRCALFLTLSVGLLVANDVISHDERSVLRAAAASLRARRSMG